MTQVPGRRVPFGLLVSQEEEEDRMRDIEQLCMIPHGRKLGIYAHACTLQTCIVRSSAEARICNATMSTLRSRGVVSESELVKIIYLHQ